MDRIVAIISMLAAVGSVFIAVATLRNGREQLKYAKQAVGEGVEDEKRKKPIFWDAVLGMVVIQGTFVVLEAVLLLALKVFHSEPISARETWSVFAVGWLIMGGFNLSYLKMVLWARKYGEPDRTERVTLTCGILLMILSVSIFVQVI